MNHLNNKLKHYKSILREADVLHLIKIGAPKTEYDGEALYLSQHILEDDSLQVIQQKIWDCFFKSFCTGVSFDLHGVETKWEASMETAIKTIGSVNSYEELAKRIKLIKEYEELVARACALRCYH
jgi:hypothetical protein